MAKTPNYGMIRCFACGATALLELEHRDGMLVMRCSCTCGAEPQSFVQAPQGWTLLEEEARCNTCHYRDGYACTRVVSRCIVKTAERPMRIEEYMHSPIGRPDCCPRLAKADA